ncbi:MAG: hypothetical protein Q9174_005167 [Haloplaca sp. 1 TL-2023]
MTSVPANTPTGAGFQNPDFPNHFGPNDARVIIYGYTPSFALCIVAIVLFAISFGLHLFQLIRYRVCFFTPLALACFLETIGYTFRSLSSKQNPYSIIWFVVQYFLIVVSPVFISASIYVCINRLIPWAKSVGYTLDQWHLRPKLILWGFVTVDIVTTIMQITGAALIGKSQSDRKDPTTGNNILLAGLVIQSFSFTIFLAVWTLFRIALGSDSALKPMVRSKDQFILALAVANVLVYLRTIFRLAETAEGVFGTISTNETLFGCLEFTPVAIAVWILAAWHPGRWLPKIIDETKGTSPSATLENGSAEEK